MMFVFVFFKQRNVFHTYSRRLFIIFSFCFWLLYCMTLVQVMERFAPWLVSSVECLPVSLSIETMPSVTPLYYEAPQWAHPFDDGHKPPPPGAFSTAPTIEPPMEIDRQSISCDHLLVASLHTPIKAWPDWPACRCHCWMFCRVWKAWLGSMLWLHGGLHAGVALDSRPSLSHGDCTHSV